MTSSNPSQQLVRSDFSPSPFEHGYDVDGLEEINPRFICIFCSRIIREPIQLIECGHRSCRECFEHQAATTTDGNVECPCEDCHEKTNKDNVCHSCFFPLIRNIFLLFFEDHDRQSIQTRIR